MALEHLAIILDGNRRWAKGKGLPTLEGHRRGYDNVKTIGLAALERGVKHFSVFAFSTENWKRSKEEVGYLMDLLHFALTSEVDFYMKHNVRLKVIGRREGLSDKLCQAIDEAEQKTANNTAGQINLCINYGGRAEIVDAVKQLVAEGVSADNITEELITSKTWMHDIPEPDLIIRTSGEQRLSGFLTWSGVYSELLFLEKHWPDFMVEDLEAAIAEFGDRERRFGK
ncbi:MAG: polyprenyl diphosphate synthase [Patescibacteria group bacterium]